jgi:hypothetical protein
LCEQERPAASGGAFLFGLGATDDWVVGQFDA